MGVSRAQDVRVGEVEQLLELLVRKERVESGPIVSVRGRVDADDSLSGAKFAVERRGERRQPVEPS